MPPVFTSMFVLGVEYPISAPMYPGPYPEGMETPHNRALWDGMYELGLKIGRAIERCKDVGLSEHTMGYFASAQEYSDIAGELTVVRPWVKEYMQGLLEIS